MYRLIIYDLNSTKNVTSIRVEWYTPLIPAFERLRQKDQELITNLCYIRPCQKKKVDSTWCSHACYVLCLSLWATVSCSTACFLSPAFLSSPECWDDTGHHLWLLAQLLLSVFQPFCCMAVSCIKYRVESLFFDQVCYLTGSISIHIFCKHLTLLQYFILFTFAHVLCTS